VRRPGPRVPLGRQRHAEGREGADDHVGVPLAEHRAEIVELPGRVGQDEIVEHALEVAHHLEPAALRFAHALEALEGRVPRPRREVA
jgi:hypothetical protein